MPVGIAPRTRWGTFLTIAIRSFYGRPSLPVDRVAALSDNACGTAYSKTGTARPALDRDHRQATRRRSRCHDLPKRRQCRRCRVRHAGGIDGIAASLEDHGTGFGAEWLAGDRD